MSLHREAASAEEDASLGKAGIGDEWKDAHPLWNAEVLLILQHHATSAAKEETPRNQSAQTTQLLQQTMQYVRSLNNYHSQAAVDEAMTSGHTHTGRRTSSVTGANSCVILCPCCCIPTRRAIALCCRCAVVLTFAVCLSFVALCPSPLSLLQSSGQVSRSGQMGVGPVEQFAHR